MNPSTGAAVALDAPPVIATPRRARAWLLAAGCLAAMTASAAGAYVLADDSGKVTSLESQINDARSARADARERVSDLEAQTSDLQAQVTTLEGKVTALRDRLRAETALNHDTGPAGGASAAPTASLHLGAAATVGDLILKPTSLVQSGTGSGTVKWTATITAKNVGSSPLSIFCGGGDATLVDSQGREFEGESVLAGNTANCGDDLGPGLTADNYKVSFKLPTGAKPAVLTMWGDMDYEDSAKDWSVR